MIALLPMVLAFLVQVYPQPHAGALLDDLHSLAEPTRVLYVAAHPDDENTQLLSWLVHERGIEAAYLSLTRGDGGQNLIGTEQGELLGVIRTFELLSARALDGAGQFLGTMRDFGYSKTAEETLAIWGEERALRDLVWVIRSYRPDIVVTRFPEQGETHGHHLASARLARQAYALAGDSTAFTEQLAVAEPWQPRRLVHNVPSWNLLPENVDPGWFSVDVGGYSSLLGLAWAELAALSRSRHQSQGFGSAPRRGALVEYFTLLEGEPVVDGDPFALPDSDWASRGGSTVSAAVNSAIETFDPRAPASAVPALLDVRRALEDLADLPLAASTRAQVDDLIVACAGLWLDVRSSRDSVTPGETIDVTLDTQARGAVAVELMGIELGGTPVATTSGAIGSAFATTTLSITVPSDAPLQTHFWLTDAAGQGHDNLDDLSLVGASYVPPLIADVTVRVGGEELVVQRPLRHVWVDPVRGERVRPVQVLPPLTVGTDQEALLVRPGEDAVLRASVHAFGDVTAGSVSINVPEGWTATPDHFDITLARGESQTIAIEVEAPEDASVGELRFVASAGGSFSTLRADRIEYDHIPPQYVTRDNAVRVVPATWAPLDRRVLYISGPGDRVAESLAAAGVEVEVVDVAGVGAVDLEPFDAIVVGIRAFNAAPALHAELGRLLERVAEGAVLVVQYQTNSRIAPLVGQIGPAPLTVGRGRVTDETAQVELVANDLGVFEGPNALADADFEGWVQERGLYFAESWDPAWIPLLRMADPGESPLDGALLAARHGEGVVYYTGLSFFRQLPAGVPGAYRLLLNLLATEL
jgi:LmbE family N-acetylglucosaminyl deacetylase